MLSAIDIDRALAGGVGKLLPEQAVLRALVAVQQKLVEHGVEVLENAGNNLIKDVDIDAALYALGSLFVAPLLKNLADGLGSRQEDDRAILSDALPVVDDQRLQIIRHYDADGRTGLESFLLFEMGLDHVSSMLVRVGEAG